MLVTKGVVSRCGEHVHNTGTGTLFAELHLQDSVIYWLSGYLIRQHIEFAMRDFEVGCRIFML
jgi:hypothetical protein